MSPPNSAEATAGLQFLVSDGQVSPLTISGDVFSPAPPVTIRLPTGEQFDRLLWLLGLTPQERAFVQAAADTPSDGGTLGAFADWLDEQHDREVDAARIRESMARRA